MAEILTRDLFGDLTTLPSGRRGRPAHVWSQEAENRVILGCAMGWSTERIAQGLGVTPPTLRKYYFSALKVRDMARDRYDLWRAARLAECAGAGNVGAFRELDKIMHKMDMARQAREIDEVQSEVAPKPLGKKAAARASAETAASEGWGGDLDPQRLRH